MTRRERDDHKKRRRHRFDGALKVACDVIGIGYGAIEADPGTCQIDGHVMLNTGLSRDGKYVQMMDDHGQLINQQLRVAPVVYEMTTNRDAILQPADRCRRRVESTD